MQKLFYLLVLIPSLVFGSEDVTLPVQTIQGVEDPVPLGELVQLKVSPISEKPLHYQSSSYDWVLLDTSNNTFYARYRTAYENTEVFFGAGLKPKLIKVICSATHLYADDLKSPTFIKTKTILMKSDLYIGDGLPPTPDPTPTPPTPPPDPTPPPGPAPIPEEGFRVLIIYESGKSLDSKQQLILAGAEVRNYLDSKCASESTGTKAYRIYDKDIDVSADSPTWRDAMARKRDSVPWVIISNGKSGYEGELPKTTSEFISLCDKYGGK